MKNFLKTFSVTIPAGENESSLAAAGTAFTIYETNAPFIIYDDSGSRFEIDRACRIESEGGEKFTRLTLVRPTGFDGTITVKIAVGSGVRFIDGRTQISAKNLGFPVYEAPSRLVGKLLAGGVINGLTTVSLNAVAPAADLKSRKAVIVSNDDPANKLEILDAAGTACVRVYPFTSVRLDISGPVSVRNPNGASVAACVAEIWYTGTPGE